MKKQKLLTSFKLRNGTSVIGRKIKELNDTIVPYTYANDKQAEKALNQFSNDHKDYRFYIYRPVGNNVVRYIAIKTLNQVVFGVNFQS